MTRCTANKIYIKKNPDHTDISVPHWYQFKNHIALALPHIHIQPFPLSRIAELATCRVLLQRHKISFRKSTLALRSQSSLMFSADRCDPPHYVTICIARINLAKNTGGPQTRPWVLAYLIYNVFKLEKGG